MEERLTIDSTAVQSFLKASIHTKGIGTISPKYAEYIIIMKQI